MKSVLHGLLIVAVLAAVLLMPYRAFIGPVRNLLPGGGGADAVSSASVILDAPSGNFVVLLNGARHQRYDNARDWAAFFRGESLVMMDDVDCLVAESDDSAFEMADSYRSRLPENQMRLRREDGLMMVSRAEVGGYDVIVISGLLAVLLSELLGEALERAKRGRQRPMREFKDGDFVRREHE